MARTAKKPGYYVECFERCRHAWWCLRKYGNHERVATSEGYDSKRGLAAARRNCLQSATAVAKFGGFPLKVTWPKLSAKKPAKKTR